MLGLPALAAALAVVAAVGLPCETAGGAIDLRALLVALVGALAEAGRVVGPLKGHTSESAFLKSLGLGFYQNHEGMGLSRNWMPCNCNSG